MKLRRIYYENHIQSFSTAIQEAILYETPHTKIVNLPPEFQYLAGEYTDLGFEDYELGSDDRLTYLRSFAKDGLLVPHTPWKIRHDYPGATMFEPVSSTDVNLPSLPSDWPAYAVVNKPGPGNHLNWIGKKARPDRYPSNIDFTLYTDQGLGWLLIGPQQWQ